MGVGQRAGGVVPRCRQVSERFATTDLCTYREQAHLSHQDSTC